MMEVSTGSMPVFCVFMVLLGAPGGLYRGEFITLCLYQFGSSAILCNAL